jgi:acetyl-CoA C-acetyltransferase
MEELKRILAKIAVKNHANGAKNPKAHFQREIAMEDVLKAPTVAWPLGLYDCCGVSDGAAVAVITRWPEVLRPPDRCERAADDL